MKAISVRQPWGWLICKGYKNIENRSWNRTMLNDPQTPNRFYVHCGRKFDVESHDWLLRFVEEPIVQIDEEFRHAINHMVHYFSTYPEWGLGCIIGEVDIVKTVIEHKSNWFTGPYGFVLKNPCLYEKPIPCKGSLGLFEPAFFELPDTNLCKGETK